MCMDPLSGATPQWSPKALNGAMALCTTEAKLPDVVSTLVEFKAKAVLVLLEAEANGAAPAGSWS